VTSGSFALRILFKAQLSMLNTRDTYLETGELAGDGEKGIEIVYSEEKYFWAD
jgi:hypothetical protein